jgi:hypothetical protein
MEICQFLGLTVVSKVRPSLNTSLLGTHHWSTTLSQWAKWNGNIPHHLSRCLGHNYSRKSNAYSLGLKWTDTWTLCGEGLAVHRGHCCEMLHDLLKLAVHSKRWRLLTAGVVVAWPCSPTLSWSCSATEILGFRASSNQPRPPPFGFPSPPPPPKML